MSYRRRRIRTRARVIVVTHASGVRRACRVIRMRTNNGVCIRIRIITSIRSIRFRVIIRGRIRMRGCAITRTSIRSCIVSRIRNIIMN